VAGTSLRLAFQTPSTLHSSETLVFTEYDEEAIAATGTTATATIQLILFNSIHFNSTQRLHSYAMCHRGFSIAFTLIEK
jgi:hypothetical protein